MNKDELRDLAERIRSSNPPSSSSEKVRFIFVDGKEARGYTTLELIYDRIREGMLKTDFLVMNAFTKDPDHLYIVIDTYKGWEFRREYNGPMTIVVNMEEFNKGAVYPVWLEKGLKKYEKGRANPIKDVPAIVLPEYYMKYVKPMYIFDSKMLAVRVGGTVRMLVFSSNLAKRGSPFHAGMVYNIVSGSMRLWATADSPQSREFHLMGFSDAGFPFLEEYLISVTPRDLGRIDLFLNFVSTAVEEVMQKVAPFTTVGRPTDDEVQRTLKACDYVAKNENWKVDLFMPVRYDETPIVKMILRITQGKAKEIAEDLARKYGYLKGEIKEEEKPEERREEARTEEERNAEKIAEEVVSQLKRFGVQKEQLEEIKKQILRRMKQL